MLAGEEFVVTRAEIAQVNALLGTLTGLDSVTVKLQGADLDLADARAIFCGLYSLSGSWPPQYGFGTCYVSTVVSTRSFSTNYLSLLQAPTFQSPLIGQYSAISSIAIDVVVISQEAAK